MKKLVAMLLGLVMLLSLMGGALAETETAEATAETQTEEVAEAATGEETEETQQYDLTGVKVGISFYAYASTSAIRQLDYLIYCLEQAGAEVAYAIANNSVEQHIADIESLLEQDIDVLVFDPCQTDGFETALDDCKAAGVPVFLMGNYLEPDVYTAGEDYVTLLNADFTVQGYDVGMLASEIATNEIGGTANAIVLFGTPGSASATGRIEGCEKAVSEVDNVVLLGTQSAYNKASDAQTITENYLMSNPPETDGGVNTIICMTHNCALGAIAGVKNMGYIPNEDVYILVVDGVKEDLQAIMDGDLYAAVESPTFYADQQVELIARYLAGEELEEEYDIPPHTFTQENAQEWYDRFDSYDQLIGLE